MAIILEFLKQACPHCKGSRVEIGNRCCGLTVHGYCCLYPIPEVTECGMCYGSGVVEVAMNVEPQWLFPEIESKEFTL